jgi:hypothetical protein
MVARNAAGKPDPPGTPAAERLVCIRGASWGARITDLRASYSTYQRPGYVSHWIGVRLARDWQPE